MCMGGGGVVFCQIKITEINYRYSLYNYIHYHVSLSLRVLLDMSVTVSQFWSLQFLKVIIPPFCISEKLIGIHVNTSHVPISSCHHILHSHGAACRIVGILWRFSGTSVSCGVVVISPLVTHCVHTVDHVDAHAMQYKHVSYVRAIESDTHASRVRRARILFLHFN